MAEPRAVLVIRLGALGDLVQSFGPFAAIRARHPAARLTLLTTAPFAAWLRGGPWFDAVVVDERPSWFAPRGIARLARRLRGHDMVYDLQTSARSTRYFWLAGCPPWSGIGRFARYRHRDPGRDRLHTRERQAGQLRDAGIAACPAPDAAALGGLVGPDLVAGVGRPRVVLVPGAAAHRPDKRWPAARFAELAGLLAGAGAQVVVVGGAAERGLGGVIAAGGVGTDLTGRTTLAQLAGVLSHADAVVGNDTGPMHLAAALGRACVVLFGGASDPALTAPRMPDGAFATVLRADDLADLAVARVAACLPMVP